MPVTIRISENCEADRLASARLSDEGFGHPAPSSAAEIGPLTTGAQTTYLAERDGDIVGKARDRHYESWFGGRTVTTAGVASVTVAAEERGGGTMRLLMSALMEGARERGAAISTLVPTAPGACRRFGYESITTYEYLRVPTSQFTRITPGAGTTRRATPTDMADVHRVYSTWAQAQNGPLTRTGPSFPDPEQVFTGRAVTLAVDEAGTVVGYAIWRHTGGYQGDGLLEVDDVVALTADAHRSLMASLGSSYAVAPTTTLMSSGSGGMDTLRLLMPDRPWPSHETDHYMLAILDVAAAFEARGYRTGPPATVDFAVSGASVTGVDGAYELVVAEGRGRCRRVEHTTGPTFTPGGLALLYAGAQSCHNIAFAGGVSGGGEQYDRLDALFGGRQVHIRDSF